MYSAGIDARVTKRLSANIDWVGQTVFNGARLRLGNTMVPGLCDTPAFGGGCLNPLPPGQVQSVEGAKGTYVIDNAVLGARFLPFGKFLLSAGVELKLDEGGLRAKAIPYASATYTFH